MVLKVIFIKSRQVFVPHRKHKSGVQITSVLELPVFVIPCPHAAVGSGHARVGAASWQHRQLSKSRLALGAPKPAKGPQDPSSSLAIAGASCLLSLPRLYSPNTSLLGRCDRLERWRVMEEDFKIYHSSILTPLLLQEGLRIKQNEERKKSKNAGFVFFFSPLKYRFFFKE